MSIEEVGCCGAYCATCKVFKNRLCKGCKIGYSDGSRELSKAKCKIKICCINKSFASCADCEDIESCALLKDFLSKKGYKYRKYSEALFYIKEYGYDKFISIADSWSNQYGKY